MSESLTNSHLKQFHSSIVLFIFQRASENPWKTTSTISLINLINTTWISMGISGNDGTKRWWVPWRCAGSAFLRPFRTRTLCRGRPRESSAQKGAIYGDPHGDPQASWMVYMENPCMRTGGSPMTKRKPPFFVNSPHFFFINSWYKHVQAKLFVFNQ